MEALNAVWQALAALVLVDPGEAYETRALVTGRVLLALEAAWTAGITEYDVERELCKWTAARQDKLRPVVNHALAVLDASDGPGQCFLRRIDRALREAKRVPGVR